MTIMAMLHLTTTTVLQQNFQSHPSMSQITRCVRWTMLAPMVTLINNLQRPAISGGSDTMPTVRLNLLLKHGRALDIKNDLLLRINLGLKVKRMGTPSSMMAILWMSPELHNQGQSARETKTGCLTCRKRKKKCDETRPECKLRTAHASGVTLTLSRQQLFSWWISVCRIPYDSRSAHVEQTKSFQ